MNEAQYGPEERVLLDAIRANPDDDSLLLVYADWLEERGDSRADYVRAVSTVIQLHWRDPRCPEAESVVRSTRSDFPTEWVAMVTPRVVGPAVDTVTEDQVTEYMADCWNIGVVRNLYADWLESHGELARAEYLRAEIAFWAALYESVGERRRRHNRMIAARRLVDDDFVARVARTRVENCSSDEEPNCPVYWLSFESTVDDLVRYCQQCGRDVHYCNSLSEAGERHLGNERIALDSSRLQFTIGGEHPSLRCHWSDQQLNISLANPAQLFGSDDDGG